MLRKQDTVGGIVFRSPIQISDEHFSELETAGNLILNAEQREALFLALNHFDSLEMVSKEAPQIRDALKRAEKLLESSDFLYEFFAPGHQEMRPVREECRVEGIYEEDLSEPIKSKIDKALLARLKSAPHWKSSCDLSHVKFRYFSGYLKEVINHYMEQPIDKSGRTSRENFNRLIVRLIEIYESSPKKKRGRRPPEGMGEQAFIQSFLEIVPGNCGFNLKREWDIHLKAQLKTAIHRAKKSRKKPLSAGNKKKKSS